MYVCMCKFIHACTYVCKFVWFWMCVSVGEWVKQDNQFERLKEENTNMKANERDKERERLNKKRGQCEE